MHSSRVNHNHLAMELEGTALCGWINETNSLFSLDVKGLFFPDTPGGFSQYR